MKNQKEHKGNWRGIKETADNIQNNYNSDSVDYDAITNLVLQLEPLERQFRDKYRRFCKSRGENRIIYFKSINQYFALADMRETLWRTLPSWPIEDCLKKYYTPLDEIIEIVIRESNRVASD